MQTILRQKIAYNYSLTNAISKNFSFLYVLLHVAVSILHGAMRMRQAFSELSLGQLIIRGRGMAMSTQQGKWSDEDSRDQNF